MDIVLDEKTNRIYGNEIITYHNNSNDYLEYLWVQLDQNMRAPDSKTPLAQSQGARPFIPTSKYKDDYLSDGKDFGFKIQAVKKADGSALSHTINRTMMRINFLSRWLRQRVINLAFNGITSSIIR